MRYTIRTRPEGGSSSFAVLVADARNALNIIECLTARGVQNVEVVDQDGKVYGQMELMRAAGEGFPGEG